ncbi:MAG: hypothetical protein CME70_10225 [Halobacteriovorax sp.]|nr:hypothetical protein [Halobacteriovorax sp.]|tara:strand:+ start:29726 stop:30571 length:846 start_codon:yes stop_codon:yes gene_type:complete
MATLLGCGEKKSKLDPAWDGVNETYTPLKKKKEKDFDPQIRVSDEMLREMAEHLFILQENTSEELKISEGLTFGVTLLHYVGQMGNITLNSSQINKLVDGFEKLIEKPVDEKIKFVLNQIDTLTFRKLPGGRCRIRLQGKYKEGIVYMINQDGDGSTAVKKIKYFQAKNGSEVELNIVDTLQERQELHEFVKDTGKRDSIHKDIPRYIEDYFHIESPSPIIKMKFEGMIVRVLTDTMWKNIDFRFKFGWSIPLFRIGEKKIPGIMFFLKKNFAKTKISLDQ